MEDGRACPVLGAPHPKAAPWDTATLHPTCGEPVLCFMLHQLAAESHVWALR